VPSHRQRRHDGHARSVPGHGNLALPAVRRRGLGDHLGERTAQHRGRGSRSTRSRPIPGRRPRSAPSRVPGSESGMAAIRATRRGSTWPPRLIAVLRRRDGDPYASRPVRPRAAGAGLPGPRFTRSHPSHRSGTGAKQPRHCIDLCDLSKRPPLPAEGRRPAPACGRRRRERISASPSDGSRSPHRPIASTACRIEVQWQRRHRRPAMPPVAFAATPVRRTPLPPAAGRPKPS
jgi:hypothetical protein